MSLNSPPRSSSCVWMFGGGIGGLSCTVSLAGFQVAPDGIKVGLVIVFPARKASSASAAAATIALALSILNRFLCSLRFAVISSEVTGKFVRQAGPSRFRKSWYLSLTTQPYGHLFVLRTRTVHSSKGYLFQRNLSAIKLSSPLGWSPRWIS